MQIEELLTEREVLLRTIHLLPKNFEQLEQRIESFGVEPLTVSSAPQSSHPIIAPNTTDVEELKSIVTNLINDIDRRRDTMAELKKKRDDLQEAFKSEKEDFDDKRADYEDRRAELQNESVELKPLIESLEGRQDKAEKAVIYIEEQINEAEQQLSAFKSAGSNAGEDLKAQLAEEQAKAELLLQNNESQVTDFDAARKQMVLWKSLVSMFEAKIASTAEEHNLGSEDN
ncbi:unnamed protein product [Strongylus vulgaris]|uniref:Uncharacterized protein n=1 Tax=Strongylus vulgaris TaxID=40348 RepID=A0A3P7IPI1_STRVU|nr:unnamed protein product [Strongylus vulgaris]